MTTVTETDAWRKCAPTIDPEFAALIPPLAAEERAQLEANLLRDGCRDPLVTWQGILLDGHNRLDICTRHGIEWQATEVALPSRDDAKVWIIRNQFGRRNLAPYQRVEMALTLEPLLAAQAKARQGTRTDLEPCGNIATKSERTRDELARLAGVGARTIDKGKYLAEHAEEPVKAKLRKGETTVNREYNRLRKDESKAAKVAKGANVVLPESLTLLCQDSTKALAEWPDACVDAIITDPPYHDEHLGLWRSVAEQASRILKPGGFFVAYSGQRFLPEVFAALTEHLDYYWLMSCPHKHGQLRFWERKIWNAWKPVLVFTRGKPEGKWFTDTLTGGEAEAKALHDWAQPLAEAKSLVDMFTEPGQTVLDPFAGSGTIPIAAALSGRVAVGMEIEQENVMAARSRWQEVAP